MFFAAFKSAFSVGTKREGSLGQDSNGMMRLSLELPMESGIVPCPRDLLAQVAAGSGPVLYIPFCVLFLLLLAANIPGSVLAWLGRVWSEVWREEGVKGISALCSREKLQVHIQRDFLPMGSAWAAPVWELLQLSRNQT